MSLIRKVLATAVLLGAGPALMVSAPTALAADAKACQLEIEGNDLIQFNKKQLQVPASCAEVQLTLKHVGKLPEATMGHNWVLVKAEDVNAVANAGIAAGAKNNYVPQNDKRVIAHTEVIGGGESTTIKFPTKGLQKGTPYMYVCTFPGHSALMRGAFILE